MTVTDVRKDIDALTLTITAVFAAPAERVWTVWSDPRRLERWWGPPTHPATVTDHDLRPGGVVRYFMTSPEGDKYHGFWTIATVDAPHHLSFEDAFADDAGNAAPNMPVTRAEVTLRELGDGRTEMIVASTFPSAEAMEQLIEMGMLAGIVLCITQITPLLAEA
ncbi:MAG: SRPBCC domain-containing protein [Acidimicrobiales bacterium]|nr:SRPBCC domain-containing protein [Acidimicrobiales bacterium]